MELYEFFREHPRCALGFSGGTDSAYLLAAGREYGAELRPYYVRTAFQPRFELDDAFRMCEKLNVGLTVLDYDILAVPGVADNPGTAVISVSGPYLRSYASTRRRTALTPSSTATTPRTTPATAPACVLCVSSAC